MYTPKEFLFLYINTLLYFVLLYIIVNGLKKSGNCLIQINVSFFLHLLLKIVKSIHQTISDGEN